MYTTSVDETRTFQRSDQSSSCIQGGTMLWDDIIYVALLLLVIEIGPFYREIKDVKVKQWTSTAIGLILTAIVSGRYVIHPIITTVINAIIITKLSSKICHVTSLFFSFFYLLVVFRLGELVDAFPIPPTHTNLIVMILTIKLSGLAFEINTAANPPADDDPEGKCSEALKKIEFMDVIHYGYSYFGLLTGPHYRYRTYWDSLHRPFAKYADPWPLTFYKLKQIAVFIVMFLVLADIFPTKYAASEEFSQRSFLYKHMYMLPAFGVFRLRMYIGMILAECACQMAGCGVYPARCKPVQGLGPRDYKTIRELSETPEKLKDEEYNYDTVHNMNVWQVETCIQVRTAMKVWNTCIQYWMATCIYKRFPYKPLRTLATFTLSALWHGYAPGYYLCICQIPAFLIVEDMCLKFYKHSKEGSFAKKGWHVFMWILKTNFMAYLAMPFLILDVQDVFKYYKAVYYVGHIEGVILLIVFCLLKPYILTDKEEDKEKKK